MTRILLVASSEDDGGLARVAATIALGLPARGVDVAVVLQRDGRVGARLRDGRVPVATVPELPETLDRTATGERSVAAIPANIARIPVAIGSIRDLARRHRAGLIYSHGSWPNHIAAEATRRLPGVGAVWHVHTAFSRLNDLVAQVAARRGDLRAVIAVSQSAAAPYHRLDLPVDVIYNAMPVAACRAAAESPVLRTRLDIPSDAFVFGYAGRLVRHKGVYVLAEAAARVLRNIPHAYFVLLGANQRSSSEDVLGALRAQLAPFESRVRMPGYVDEVLRLVAGFDAAVVPSTYEDPCPLAAIEALALGVPVIGSRIGGIPELVADGESGVLVPAGDAAALAAAISGVARDPDSRRRLAAGARAAASARFEEDAMIDRVANVLRRASTPRDSDPRRDPT